MKVGLQEEISRHGPIVRAVSGGETVNVISLLSGLGVSIVPAEVITIGNSGWSVKNLVPRVSAKFLSVVYFEANPLLCYDFGSATVQTILIDFPT